VVGTRVADQAIEIPFQAAPRAECFQRPLQVARTAGMNRTEWSPSPGTASRHRPDQVFDITGIRTYQTRPASNSGGVGGRIDGQPDLGGVAA
jgi:hypothetical protein